MKEKGGFFVYNPMTQKHYSKKGMTKKQAEKQRVAIILSEHRGEKNLSPYFV